MATMTRNLITMEMRLMVMAMKFDDNGHINNGKVVKGDDKGVQ